jgi:hypothetical protein
MLRQETSKTSRIYHYEKVGSRLKFEGAKSGFQESFSDTPPFRTVQDPKNPRIFEKMPNTPVFMY